MSKSVVFYGFLCAVSLILVSGLPIEKENEDETGVAAVQNDEQSNILKYNSAADAQLRMTREAAPQHHHHHRGRGGYSGSGAQAGSFNFGSGRGRGGISGSVSEASSFSGGRGRGGGGSRAQSESFNFNLPFGGSVSGSESSAGSFGRRG